MILSKVEKPARYTGGELNSVIKEGAELNFALCFPDIYDLGMSNLGLGILYEVLNGVKGVFAQRAYCPWTDMAAELRAAGEPLRALETQTPLRDFDIVGFNLSYEMCYSNVLCMLELAGLPLLASERTDDMPLVIGGGACTVNPEPLADFFDMFAIGEGEEQVVELCECYKEHKRKGYGKAEFLRAAAGIEGIYVPTLYDVEYAEDGRVSRITPKEGAPERVSRRFVRDFEHTQAMKKPVLPYINTVHDRCTLEIMRGCPNGCRFCQAGYYTRPVRERGADTVLNQARGIIAATGYEEISLCSLSSGDHSQIVPLLDSLIGEFAEKRVSVSLPSLRANNFHFGKQLTQVRKTGFTFAPEAGTQRLRDVINKNITEEEILETARRAFESGASTIKLYFMIGLPTETMEDIEGIAELVFAIREVFYSIPKQERGGNLSINVSASCFVPKPCTPFQWMAQDSMEALREKQFYLKDRLKQRGIKFNYHDAKLSYLEAVLARGDRRLSAVLLAAYKSGAVFDSWQEHFSFERYTNAFRECGIDGDFYACRERDTDEVLPYAHIDSRISTAYLARELNKARAGETTPICKQACSGCGMQKDCGFAGGVS